MGILAMTALVLTGLGCRDYCRGNGYTVEVQHLGDAPVQLEVRTSNGDVFRPDSLRPQENYRFEDGPDGEMQVQFRFAGGKDTTAVLQVRGCGIWSLRADSAERLALEEYLPE